MIGYPDKDATFASFIQIENVVGLQFYMLCFASSRTKAGFGKMLGICCPYFSSELSLVGLHSTSIKLKAALEK